MEIRRDLNSTAKSSHEEDTDEQSNTTIDSDIENTALVRINEQIDERISVTNFFSSLFNGILRKRKYAMDFKHYADFTNDSNSCIKRDIKPLPNRPPSMKTWEDIFNNCIYYTFMTFEQMESVKNHMILPESTILSSFWYQKKFLTQKPSTMPPFRFSKTFREISAYFEKNIGESQMLSESVSCCGINFRLLLSLEGTTLKALLQKSKEAGNVNLGYELYCFDHRFPLGKMQLLNLWTPVTSCDADGGGHAYEIPLNPIKLEDKDGLDELRLVAKITFKC
jgi:hypothetical protein